jgi:hypothetical protein
VVTEIVVSGAGKLDPLRGTATRRLLPAPGSGLRNDELRDVNRECRGVRQSVIVTEQRRAESVGELDVEPVGDREVVAVGLCRAQERSNGGTMERPVDELIEGLRGLSGGKCIGALPPAENPRHLVVKVFGDGEFRVGRDELAEGFAAGGVGDQFGSGGGVDDDGDGQISPSDRSSASLSAARTAMVIAGRWSK